MSRALLVVFMTFVVGATAGAESVSDGHGGDDGEAAAERFPPPALPPRPLRAPPRGAEASVSGSAPSGTRSAAEGGGAGTAARGDAASPGESGAPGEPRATPAAELRELAVRLNAIGGETISADELAELTPDVLQLLRQTLDAAEEGTAAAVIPGEGTPYSAPGGGASAAATGSGARDGGSSLLSPVGAPGKAEGAVLSGAERGTGPGSDPGPLATRPPGFAADAAGASAARTAAVVGFAKDPLFKVKPGATHSRSRLARVVAALHRKLRGSGAAPVPPAPPAERLIASFTATPTEVPLGIGWMILGFVGMAVLGWLAGRRFR